jgi:LysM repeat protein
LNKDDEKDYGVKTDFSFDSADQDYELIDAEDDGGYGYEEEDEPADYSPSPLEFRRKRTEEDLEWLPERGAEADSPKPRKARPEPLARESARPREKAPAKEPATPRYRQVIADDDYDDYETEDNSAALKIIIAALCIIFILVLAVLVYKINTVGAELEAAKSELSLRPTEEERQAALEKARESELLAAKLQDELDALKSQGANPSEQGDSAETYTIQSGDTLGAIAVQFGVSVAQLMEWNSLDDDMIKQGQVLRVAPPLTE